MAAQRYYYSDSITDFLSRNTNEIVGDLTLASQHDINDETSKSWVEEIETMREVLAPYEGRGSVYFEYNIPRMGRRVDVIAVIDGIIFVLEYKTAERKFSHEALVQVWDYAIDLKNFQEGSLERILIPILVVPSEKGSRCQTDLKLHQRVIMSASRLVTAYFSQGSAPRYLFKYIWSMALGV